MDRQQLRRHLEATKRHTYSSVRRSISTVPETPLERSSLKRHSADVAERIIGESNDLVESASVERKKEGGELGERFGESKVVVENRVVENRVVENKVVENRVVENKMDNKVENKINNKVDNKMDNKVDNKVDNKMDNKMDNKVMNNKINNKINNPITETNPEETKPTQEPPFPQNPALQQSTIPFLPHFETVYVLSTFHDES